MEVDGIKKGLKKYQPFNSYYLMLLFDYNVKLRCLVIIKGYVEDVNSSF